MNRTQQEVRHFTELEHIWSGQKTVAGQKRYDNKGRLFRKYCKPGKNDKILEIGCGDGEFTKRLQGTGATIFATDITPAVLERSKRSVMFKGLRYKADNCEKLSFKDKTFTIVCGVSILHHVNYLKTLQESFRVLKPGGKIFFTEPNLLNPILYITQTIRPLRKMMEFSPSERALIRMNIEHVLKNIGFRKVIIKNYDFLFPWTPEFMIGSVEKLGKFLEETPLIKEISGSLIIYAVK